MALDYRFNSNLFKCVIVAFIVLFTSVFFSCKNNDNKVAYNDDVVILFTNDLNCAITNSQRDFNTDKIDPNTGEVIKRKVNTLGLAKIKGFKEYNKQSGSNVVLLDTGNYLWGDGAGSLISQLSQGADIINFMYNAGYDYLGFGNREFQYGIDKVERFLNISKGKIKYLCSNIRAQNIIPRPKQLDKDNFISGFDIVKFGKTQVAFIGITLKESENSGPIDGYEVYDIDATCANINQLVLRAKDIMRANKDGNGNNYVVLLSHLGNNESTNYNVKYLIEHVSGLTAVIDGYSTDPSEYVQDDTLTDLDGNPVYYGHAGRYGEKIGKLSIANDEISVDYYTDSEIVFEEANLKNKVVDVMSFVNDNLNTAIGFTKRDISRNGRPLDFEEDEEAQEAAPDVPYYLPEYKNSLNTESFAGDLITDGYRNVANEYLRAEGINIRAAVANASSIGKSPILIPDDSRREKDDASRQSKPITLADCFNLMYQYSYLGYTEFNGVELKEFFEHAISHRKRSSITIPSGDNNVIFKSYELNGSKNDLILCTDDKDFNGFLQVSGLKIKCYLDEDNPAENRVTQILVLKENAVTDRTDVPSAWESVDLTDETKYYTVVGTNYILKFGGDGYKNLGGFEETSSKFKYLYSGKELLTEAQCLAEYIGLLPNKAILLRSVNTGRYEFSDIE